MKILHTADIHLGAKHKKLSSEKQTIIRNEINSQIKELFSIAKENDYDAILICGDLFHGKDTTNKVKNIFFKSVEDYEKPVFYITGNHDEFFEDEAPQNFYVLDKNNPKVEYKGVNFWCSENLEFLKENFNSNQINVMLLHGNIENKTDNDFVDIKEIEKYKFNYVAMGHIHSYKRYENKNNLYVYSGSLFSNGFDECGDKGYVQVNLNKGEIKVNFIPFSKQRYMIAKVDISSARDKKDITNLILETLKQNEINQKDVIKVILEGYCDEDFDKELDKVKLCFDNYFSLTIEDNTRVKIDIEKYKNEKLSFKAEFINLVENSSESEEIKNLICRIGIESLKKEDLSIW